MAKKIGIPCLICKAFIKFWNPDYFGSIENAEKFYNLRKIEITHKDKKVSGYICYFCYQRIFGKEIVQEQGPKQC
jgi:glutaredoxin-related protein